MRLALLALLAISTTAAPALDLSPYDKKLHLCGSALGAYVISDVLERTTDIPPWQRFLIAAGTMTIASFAYEELDSHGYRDMSDAHAGTLGAVLGASSHAALTWSVSLGHRGSEPSVSLLWRLP